MASKGTCVCYIPGNHDEVLREYAGLQFGGVEIHKRAIHETATGKRFLLLHGDEFDTVVQCHKWLAVLGSAAYEHLILLNRVFNALRRVFRLPYYSLSGAIKRRVKRAVSYTGRFADAAVHAARKANVQGVICGHIHQPAIEEWDGIRYCNCGDWVENCTALVENDLGEFVILKCTEEWTQGLPVSPEEDEADLAEVPEPETVAIFTAMRGIVRGTAELLPLCPTAP
jgi:UDP-2,3-diacylglucosamine pyrophosphatase LpxH